MTIKEEYNLFLEHVDNITNRRPGITTTYIGVNTAILSVISLILVNSGFESWAQRFAILILLTAGIVASDLWRRLISQYKTLLDWWYTQLRQLEEQTPNSSKLISKEYLELYTIKAKNPIGMTKYELYLTWLFTIIYLIFVLVILIVLIISH